ncbi:hypothetical protein WJX81_001438 [Elliptochloris bilobata]|uniref:phosphoribosylanthranilate isomerase n=1 Tax=Elliptochloris bilobata TaxID=381761 RepID=A0AAW1QL65_9CHLO
MWQRGRRAVSPATAQRIAAVAHRHGVQAVGVFVDEDAVSIATACTDAGLDMAQLHGNGARAAYLALPPELPVVYVLHADAGGALQTPLPPIKGPRQPEWLLVDGLTGGSGQALDWARLHVPSGLARRGWLLAGGLAPANVAVALRAARPAGVDVASGVAGPDGLRKDPALMAAFVKAVRAADG